MELNAVRVGEELDLRALEPLLAKRFGQGSGPWSVRQFVAGHSNLTYLLSNGHAEVVLRRPPKGPVPPRAHDVVREARVLTALNPVYRWAPRVVGVMDQASVLGFPFFLMERRAGVRIDYAGMNARKDPFKAGRQISEVMVERLVDLHAVDWLSTGLTHLVQPDGFLSRQARGWVERFERARVTDIPGAESLGQWLVTEVPPDSVPAAIHYDYKLDNVLFEPDLHDLSGVFDWEMATVGDPWVDVAVALSYWTGADDPPALHQVFGDLPVTTQPGFYTRREWLQAYCVKSGRDVPHFRWYMTFAFYKLAAILAQIYVRYLRGQTRDARFAHFDQAVRHLIGVAQAAQSGRGGV